MTKVVINRCHGGFGLSNTAEALYKQRKSIADKDWHYWDIPRDDPVLVQIVEELGEDADGMYSELGIVEIPEDVNWYVEEYDGLEWVAERHRTWT